MSATESAVIDIHGMHCDRCAARVRAVLEQLGLQVEKVDAEAGVARVASSAFEDQAIESAIAGLGFRVVAIH